MAGEISGAVVGGTATGGRGVPAGGVLVTGLVGGAARLRAELLEGLGAAPPPGIRLRAEVLDGLRADVAPELTGLCEGVAPALGDFCAGVTPELGALGAAPLLGGRGGTVPELGGRVGTVPEEGPRDAVRWLVLLLAPPTTAAAGADCGRGTVMRLWQFLQDTALPACSRDTVCGVLQVGQLNEITLAMQTPATRPDQHRPSRNRSHESNKIVQV